MQIIAARVKELRERTGAGMMECKRALAQVQGDMDAAVEWLRKTGLAKADKKAARIAAEGAIALAIAPDHMAAALVEVNSETDFVAKGDDFRAFAGQVAEQVMQADPKDVAATSNLPLDQQTVEAQRQALVARLGENIQLRRLVRLATQQGIVGHYLHGSRIGVLVILEGADVALARDIAMHIAASRPISVAAADVPADLIERERRIYAAQAQDSGKPAEIIEKMVLGRLNKYLAEVTLLGQPFVKDPDQTVGQLLQARGARVVRFVRFEVGEGLERKSEDFAQEVMAQVKGRSS